MINIVEKDMRCDLLVFKFTIGIPGLLRIYLGNLEKSENLFPWKNYGRIRLFIFFSRFFFLFLSKIADFTCVVFH